MLKRDIEKLEHLTVLVDDLTDLVHASIKADETNKFSKELDLQVRETYREIEKVAQRLILKGQPVASDLKVILKAIRRADEYRLIFRMSKKLGTSETVKNVRKVLKRQVS